MRPQPAEKPYPSEPLEWESPEKAKGVVAAHRPLCVHISSQGKPHFAHGMCHGCFVQYVTTTGGETPPPPLPASPSHKGLFEEERLQGRE